MMRTIKPKHLTVFALLILFSASAFAQPVRRRPMVDKSVVGQAEALSEAFRQASEVILPTVVKISSKTSARRVSASGLPFGFQEFFGDQYYIPESTGFGSGVIIDPKGIILTNNHVVANADDVSIELQDGQVYKAIDVRTDSQSDLAIVRIKPNRELPYADIGDSDRLRIGDWVLAVGNPFEFQSSVSAGIISAKGRSLNSPNEKEGIRSTFLQTDAAINPGNSGGPLVNLRGEIVGINTAIASKTGAFNGIGFAIPANQAKWVSGQLVRNGRVNRAWLGVGIGTLTHQIRAALNVDANVNGVLVSEVRFGAPSETSGILPGDIITHISGKRIGSSPELQRTVEQSSPGSAVEVKVLRDGRPLRLRVKTAELPDSDARKIRGRRIRLASGTRTTEFPEFGSYLYDLSSEESDELNLKHGESGVLIVRSTQTAQKLGLVPGSVIYKVGDQRIRNLSDIDDALQNARQQEHIFLTVEYPEQANRLIILPNVQ